MSDSSFSNNVDLKSRTIYLGGLITEESSRDTIQALHVLGLRDRSPIRLIINSHGGDSDEGLAMFDAIRLCPAPVIGVVYGTCQSTAAIILQACDKRLLSQHSIFMVHAGSVGHKQVHPEEFVKAAADIERDIRQMNQIFSAKTGMSLPKMTNFTRFAQYLTPAKAVEMGFADGILVPTVPAKKKVPLTYKRKRK